MTNATQALELLDQYESSRQQAIEELQAEKAVIEQQLARLMQPVNTAKPLTKDEKKCPVCGEVGHDARRHKGDKT